MHGSTPMWVFGSGAHKVFYLSVCASYVQKQPYQTCTLSMWVYYVKGLSALKLELAWRAQSKSALAKQNVVKFFSQFDFFPTLITS